MKNAFKLPPDKRNHKHQFEIGTLLRADGTDSYGKHGYCVVIEHLEFSANNFFSKEAHYRLFSQLVGTYIEIPCWVVNGFYHKVGKNQ